MGQRAKEIDWEEEEEKKRRRIIANMSIISNQEWEAGTSCEMIKLGRPSRTNGRKRLDGNSQGDCYVLQKTLNEWIRIVKPKSFQ